VLTYFEEDFMNKRGFVFEVAAILFIAVFVLAGCEQLTGNGNGTGTGTGNGNGNGNGSGRDNPFDLDSPLLVELWDSSTPPKFLGYDTGLDNVPDGQPIILTSKGYCVYFGDVFYRSPVSSDAYNYGWKKYYGYKAYDSQEPNFDTIMKDTGWGYCIFFETTSNPTANDTPYALWSSNIVNAVMVNPHDGGTYYTWDTNAASRDITVRADYKLYDNTGAIRTWNDDFDWGEDRGSTLSDNIGETLTFHPLKKIGGYAELGLPNPDDLTHPLIYKVTY